MPLGGGGVGVPLALEGGHPLRFDRLGGRYAAGGATPDEDASGDPAPVHGNELRLAAVSAVVQADGPWPARPGGGSAIESAGTLASVCEKEASRRTPARCSEWTKTSGDGVG